MGHKTDRQTDTDVWKVLLGESHVSILQQGKQETGNQRELGGWYVVEVGGNPGASPCL